MCVKIIDFILYGCYHVAMVQTKRRACGDSRRQLQAFLLRFAAAVLCLAYISGLSPSPAARRAIEVGALLLCHTSKQLKQPSLRAADRDKAQNAI